MGAFTSLMSYVLFLTQLVFFLSTGLQPAILIVVFVTFCAAAYSFTSNMFREKVLVRQEFLAYKWKEWIKANGVVGLIFCIIIVIGVSIFWFGFRPQGMAVPPEMEAAFKQSRTKVVFIIHFVYALCLATHIIWTFRLLRKNKDFFQ